MKVYINNYRNHWLSPYTIMEKVLFWKKWTDPDFDLYDDKNEHYVDWLNIEWHPPPSRMRQDLSMGLCRI